MIGKDRRIDIMGIVNLTDNSYFESSRCLDKSGNPDLDKTLSRIEKMILEGATIIDIGACSTRPGSDPVGKEEEIRRLVPTVKVIREKFPSITISIDTYFSNVVKAVYNEIGDFIVNDISAGEDDPDMLSTVGSLSLPYIAMHKRGNPKTMQSLTEYSDVTKEVVEYFKEFEIKAEKAGIKDWVIDPGFGFAKTIEQNYQLLRELDKFNEFGRRILVGVSRKSMIYRHFGTTPEECLPETQVLHLEVLRKGADILRVHDVLPCAHTVELYKKFL